MQAVGIVLGVTAQRASASLKNAWRSVSGSIGEGIGRAWRGIRNSIDDLRVRGNPPQGAMCGFNSFSADTTVATEDGDVPISQIEIGDDVLAYNETTGETGEYTVTDTISHVDQVIVHLVIDGELIETTPEHPFYTIEGEWVEAENLTIGDLIWSLDGVYGAVESIDHIHTQQPMYNLTVDEAHTFFVGSGDWLVHNTCKIERIPYGSEEMSLAAQQFRLDEFRVKDGNVAVFKIEGELPDLLTERVTKSPKWLRLENNLLIARNNGHSMHSEQVLDSLLTDVGINHSQVTAVYSELSPCEYGNNCMAMFNSGRYRSGLVINYSYSYPAEVNAQVRAIGRLLKRGIKGLIP